MPTIYLELEEQLTGEDLLTKQSTIVRVEVATKGEARERVGDYIPLFSGKEYKKRIIVNNHDIKKSCEEEIL